MKRLLLLLLVPACCLAQDDASIEIRPELFAPCQLPYRTLLTSEMPAVLALGASWEAGYNTAEGDRYVNRLQNTLEHEVFYEEAVLDVRAVNGVSMIDVEMDQLGDACWRASRHRDEGVVMIIGMTNDVSDPVRYSGACTSSQSTFEGCVEAVHAPLGADGLERAEQRLTRVAMRLAWMAHSYKIDDKHYFSDDTQLVLVNSFNPLDATHAHPSCSTLQSFQDVGFSTLVGWLDFILGMPGAPQPSSVPDGWMNWSDRLYRVADTVQSEFPELDVQILELHEVLDGPGSLPPTPSLQSGSVNHCFHLTNDGHERVCHAMANLIGVPGDLCDGTLILPPDELDPPDWFGPRGRR